LQLVVADILFFQAIDLNMNGVGYFLRSVAGQRESVESEQVRIFRTG